jgi:hypothetical protein
MADGEAEKGIDTQNKTAAPGRSQVIALALLALLILFHLVNNWLWRSSNEVVYGMDRMFHQVTSLAYYDILADRVSASTLFSALTWSDYYPPLVHLVVAAFYKVFGVSMDVAALSNSLYLVLFLLALYGIGERMAGPWIGLLSAFVVSMFPIVFSMSRYLYIDFALTSLVAVNVCLLLRSERFERKGYALLYGLSLGLGMLTKWTFIAFVGVPLLVVLVSPGLFKSVWRAIRPASWQGRRLAVSALAGLGLTALWFVPNIQATAELPLGYALVPLSWLLWMLTAYFGLATSEQGANLLAALGLGAGVAAGWYLTKINFVGTFWLNAYGKPTGRSWGFERYLGFLYREQLSPVFVALLLMAVAGLVWSRWRRSDSWREFFALGVDGWVLVLWAGVSFLIFSSRVSIVHSRYIMPLLPPLGIAIALWLGRLRHRLLRAGLLALLVAGSLFQFSALTYDSMASVKDRVPLLAEGLSIQLPSTDRTDSGYWVIPDVLEYLEDHKAGERTQLGVLVNSSQVNSKQFIYMAYAEHPDVQVQELATLGWAQPAYPRLFENEFVILIDPVPDYVRRPDTVATIERLLSTPEDSFHRAYSLVQTYPLPDGRRLHLYQRRFTPPQDEDQAYYEILMADLAGQAQPGDEVVLSPPAQVYALARYGDGSLAYHPWPTGTGAISEEDLAVLEQLSAGQDRLWLVIGPSGANDPGGLLAPWLAEQFYQAGDAWYGSLQLVLFGPPGKVGTSISPEAAGAGLAEWENGISLQRIGLVEDALQLGQIVRLELLWQAAEPVQERYKVFVHLLGPEGQVVAQRDSEPVGGTRPTMNWQPGEPISDRYGLWLPADLPAGDYRLVAGLYHAETGDRVPVAALPSALLGTGRTGPVCCPPADAVPLALVRVEGDGARILAPDGN